MTNITVQDGKIVVRDGAVGTQQACCCEEAPCETQNAQSGGEGTTETTYEFPSSQQIICLTYDALSIPDQFIVEACDGQYIDTGSVSGAGCEQFTKPAGCTEVKVTVIGPANTAWTYSIGCCECPEEPPCESNEDCPEGECCVEGECVQCPECVIDGDCEFCGAGYTLVQGCSGILTDRKCCPDGSVGYVDDGGDPRFGRCLGDCDDAIDFGASGLEPTLGYCCDGQCSEEECPP